MTSRTSLTLALLACAGLALTGCGDPHSSASHGHHHHESPHGGVAVALGDHQFHLDFLAEPAEGTLNAWVMDAHAENFIRVPLEGLDVRIRVGEEWRSLRLEPQAQASTGETVGNTSHFRGSADWLKNVTGFAGEVPSIEIRGQTFTNIAFDYPAVIHPH
jgi:hypothetical protein